MWNYFIQLVKFQVWNSDYKNFGEYWLSLQTLFGTPVIWILYDVIFMIVMLLLNTVVTTLVAKVPVRTLNDAELAIFRPLGPF